MPSCQYSYIDIAALDPVRRRFAAGDAMAILTPGLDEVIWANGPGAALFGFSDIESIIGAEPQMGFAAKRQIMATSAYPKIGKDRAVTVRLASGMTSRAVAFIASEIVLPDGEDAILLAVPAAAGAGRSPAEMAARAIAGLDQAGQYAAIVDAAGGVVAASPGFGELRITTDTLAAMVAEADGDRLVKRMIPAAAALLPAGFLRLIDDPATHLLAVIDEVLPEHDENEHSGDEHDAAPDEQAAAAVEIAPGHSAASVAGSATIDAVRLERWLPVLVLGWLCGVAVLTLKLSPESTRPSVICNLETSADSAAKSPLSSTSVCDTRQRCGLFASVTWSEEGSTGLENSRISCESRSTPTVPSRGVEDRSTGGSPSS